MSLTNPKQVPFIASLRNIRKITIELKKTLLFKKKNTYTDTP